MKNIFRSLKIYNFRLFFTGQIISLTGTWMQQLAASWLAYRLTHSGLWLGLVSFISQIPILIIGPFAGAFVDRTNRQKLLIWAQIIAMIQAFALGYLTIKGIINIYYLLILFTFLGIINAFEMPARQAFVSNMVTREHMHNAIALNSTTVNFSRMLGPALAGILVARLGEGPCFIVNGFSFLAALVSLTLMRDLKPNLRKKENEPLIKAIKEGFGHLWAQPVLKTLLISVTIVNLIIMAQVITMPIFAEKILRGGAKTLGSLMAAAGLGSLLGTLWLAGRHNAKGLSKNISRSIAIISFCFLLFPLTGSFVISCGLLFITGFNSLIIFAGTNTIFQLLIEEEYRGRVMSFYTMAFLGIAPFGSLLGGFLASAIGILATYIFLGISLGILSYWTNFKIKQVKEKL
jgi:MFS family permease